MVNILEVSTIKRYLRNSILCFLLVISSFTFSQNQSKNKKSETELLSSNLKKDDLFNKTKDLIAKKEYKKAERFMRKNFKKFSEDFEINWLYAHVLWLNNKTKNAKAKFKKAYAINSNNKELQLDYVMFLYKNGETYQLEKFLKKSNNDNTNNIDYLMMQANAFFWKGDIKSSKEKIAKIKSLYPKSNATKKLEQEIEDLTAGYINTNFEYHTDSQPLNYFATHITTGEFVSRYISPSLEVSNFNFSPEDQSALIVNLSNQFYFDIIKLTAKINGGVYINNNDKTEWIGGLSLNKQLFKNTSLTASYSKSPLLTTIASTRFNLTQQTASATLDHKNKFIEINGGFYHNFFDDGNFINSISGWVLSAPIKVYKFSFQLGYGYNYSDAEEILFVRGNDGIGIYDPYFTPEEQEIHSGLFIFSYKPITKLTVQGKLNYGIQATVQNPYFVQVSTNNFEIGGFYNAPFDYSEIEGSINYAFSKKFSAKATYINQKTFFYNRENINLGLNFTF